MSNQTELNSTEAARLWHDSSFKRRAIFGCAIDTRALCTQTISGQRSSKWKHGGSTTKGLWFYQDFPKKKDINTVDSTLLSSTKMDKLSSSLSNFVYVYQLLTWFSCHTALLPPFLFFRAFWGASCWETRNFVTLWIWFLFNLPRSNLCSSAFYLF